MTHDGRVEVRFPTPCRFPERPYAFFLKELQPHGWVYPAQAQETAAAAAAAAAGGASAFGGGGAGAGSSGSSSGGLRVETRLPDDAVLGVLCPITLDVMRDPVVAADGET